MKNENTRRNIIVSIVLAVSLGGTSLSSASFERAIAQMSSNSSGAGQNQSNMMMGT